MEACVRDIDLWMVQNRLKLNQEKTEMLVFSSRYRPRSLRSFTKNLLIKPVFELKSYGGRSFVLISAVLWYDLPQSIKDSQSVETFKQKLKRHLFFTGLQRTMIFYRL